MFTSELLNQRQSSERLWIHVFMHIHVHSSTHIHVHEHIQCLCVHGAYMFVCVHSCTHSVHAQLFMYGDMLVCTGVFVYVCVCLWVHAHMCMHAFTCSYVCVYLRVHVSSPRTSYLQLLWADSGFVVGLSCALWSF